MDVRNRVVVLIDMDCFYCQVEEKLNPELKGKPIAVVQYNPWKGGGIIAVNYVARAMGVLRHMRGDEAKQKCPEIQLPSVPCLRGKADISKYRDAGKEVAKVLQRFTTLLERASIDEAYLDITASVQERIMSFNINTLSVDMMPNTFALGYQGLEELISDVQNFGGECLEFDMENVTQLLIGTLIVSEIRAAVYAETGYQCSAGIAHNKILAKLVCGMNKPNKQTVLPKHCINLLYKTLPLKKVKHLGGKFGDAVCEVMKIKLMAELKLFSEKELQTKFDEKNGTWLYNIARGNDLEPVQAKFNPKSIGCCKQLRGKLALTNLESLKRWLKDLGDEIEDRLEKDAVENNRAPKQMVVSFTTQIPDGRDVSSSRSYNFVSEDELCGELFSLKALDLILESSEGCKIKDEPDRKLIAPIKFLGISVGKFEDIDAKKTKKIIDYFGVSGSAGPSNVNENLKLNKVNTKCNNKISDKEYIFHKFFQNKDIEKDNVNQTTNELQTDGLFNSSLEKQESFFARFLTKNVSDKIVNERVTTPICTVLTCGDESNDTNYSGSTIIEEINKSIALFEDDPHEVDRVSSMRKLLGTSELDRTESDINLEEKDKSGGNLNIKKPEMNMDSILCSECGRSIPIVMLDTHADYHFALKIRNEDRQHMRETINEKNKRRHVNANVKNDINAKKTIENFLIRVDDSIPSKLCTICGIKMPLVKFQDHLDFHEAQRLNREINKPVPTVNIAKRKRKSTSPVKKPKVHCKTIDLFFR